MLDDHSIKKQYNPKYIFLKVIQCIPLSVTPATSLDEKKKQEEAKGARPLI
jgi:hypothetical protein